MLFIIVTNLKTASKIYLTCDIGELQHTGIAPLRKAVVYIYSR